jgi:hypothetical protein
MLKDDVVAKTCKESIVSMIHMPDSPSKLDYNSKSFEHEITGIQHRFTCLIDIIDEPRISDLKGMNRTR